MEVVAVVGAVLVAQFQCLEMQTDRPVDKPPDSQPDGLTNFISGVANFQIR